MTHDFVCSSQRGISKPSCRLFQAQTFVVAGRSHHLHYVLRYVFFLGRTEDPGLEGDKEGEEEKVVAAELKVVLQFLVGLTPCIQKAGKIPVLSCYA